MNGRTMGMGKGLADCGRRTGAVAGGLALAGGWLLTGCQVAAPASAPIVPHRSDLVYRAREWRRQAGMVRARDRLAVELAALDASRGELERRVARTNEDAGHVFADSFAALPRAERARTGVYLTLGFRQNTGEAAAVLEHIAASMCEDGWHARVVPLNEWGSPHDHARSIERFLRGDLPRVERAVMVGFSMGANSWICWMRDHAPGWPVRERQKLRAALFFAGALRGAAAAYWAVHAQGVEASLLRAKLKQLDGGRGEALAAVGAAAEDLWAHDRIPPLGEMLPGLKVVEYVTLPDGRDGLPARERRIRPLAFPIARQLPWIGPFDGMVEAAAQVLPPGDPTPQGIVRVFSSHGITEGWYSNGGAVSRRHGRHSERRVQAGADMVDDLLRALPASMLD